MPSILIVDDEPNIRRMIGALLRAEGYDVREAATGVQALAAIGDEEPAVALLDLMIPGELDGLAALSKIRERWLDLPIVMMSGRASLGDAVRATKLGAFNFLEKPLAPETVLLALGSALELRQTRRTARALREELGLTGQMVGDSPVMVRVREIIDRVAPSDSRVLISGESGTGKELVAAAIHDRSPRRDRPFVRVNCAAIPRDLVESEMFGHEKGAFTGATATRTGRFELAHTGTLFLDEVGDLTIEAQAKLLRAIEAKEIQRVGGNRTIRVDVRILAATNKDLARAVADGTFREDLYFRLNVIPTALPPLREREGDIVALIEHFSTLQRQRTGRPLLRWSDDALAVMRAYAWPGNVRELANIVERIAILNTGSLVRAPDVQAVLPPSTATAQGVGGGEAMAPVGAMQSELGLTDFLDLAEKQLITDALARADGNVAEAARQLRTDRPNLYRRMKRLGITGAAFVACLTASTALLFSPAHLQAQQTTLPTSDSLIPDSVRRDSLSQDVTRDTTKDTTSVPFPLSEEESPVRHVHLTITSGKTYNRVEGLPIVVGPTVVSESDALSVDAGIYGIVRTAPGIRFKEPDAGHDAHIMFRFGPDHIFGLGGQLYDVVTPVEQWQMSEPEAGLAAFLVHRDYMDYYGRHGGKITGSWIINEKAHVTVGYADERWTSVPLSDPFSLFRNSDTWRPNPQMDEGRFHIFTTDVVLDTRNDDRNPAGGWFLVGSYERGWSPSVLLAPRTDLPQTTPSPGTSSSIATDQHYGRVFFDIRRYNRISPRTQVDGRLVFGGWLQGDELPLERKLSVSGPGTLPGYDFREPVGSDIQVCTLPGQWVSTPPALCDRVVLGQLEVRTDLTGQPIGLSNAGGVSLPGIALTQRLIGVFFVDVGRGWRTTQPWPSGYKADVGTGVDMGLLGVYAAKAVTDWNQPIHLLVRVRRRF